VRSSVATVLDTKMNDEAVLRSPTPGRMNVNRSP